MPIDSLILKMLDVSTGHMTKEDSEKLDTESHGGMAPVYELSEYGWLVYIGEIDENWKESPAMSEHFIKVLNTAKELGCDYVRFDRDGREYAEFQKFEW